jgi:hypothetical protein
VIPNLCRSWIQAQHLEDDALGAYRERFARHPARLTVIEDFLLPHLADRLSGFLAKEAVFTPEYGVYSSEGSVPEQAFLAAPDPDRFFRMQRLTGTAPEFVMSPNALTYVRFRQTFQQEAFKAFFEAVSGLPLGASDDFGSHRMRPGDYLRPHTDDNRNRRLALVIYLSPEWEPEFGGSLHVLLPGREEIEIGPRYNRMVVFDVRVDAQHRVAPVRAGARLSIGGWYPKADR